MIAAPPQKKNTCGCGRLSENLLVQKARCRNATFKLENVKTPIFVKFTSKIDVSSVHDLLRRKSVGLAVCRNSVSNLQYLQKNCNFFPAYFSNVQSRLLQPIYTVGHKNVALYFCPYLHQLLTDFKNCFTGALCGQFAIM